MKEMADRIRQRMKALGLKQPRLAELCGCDQSQISKFLNGKIRTPPDLYELSKALETTVKWLKTGEDDSVYMKSNIIQATHMGNEKLTNPDVYDLIPVYGNPSGGAIRKNKDYILDKKNKPPGMEHVKDSFALQVLGDSMAPRKEHGELAYVHPYRETLPGQYCVIVQKPHGDMLYRRYIGISLDGDSIIVSQLNPPQEFNIARKSIEKIYAVEF